MVPAQTGIPLRKKGESVFIALRLSPSFEEEKRQSKDSGIFNLRKLLEEIIVKKNKHTHKSFYFKPKT